jgi:glycine/D-amino acid oxidase-like deaminating enzyme
LKRYDITIVGAGIIGLSIAWQLAQRSTLKIAVLEKGAGLGEGSSGASSAVCRTRYSLDMTMEVARDGIAAYRHWQQFTGLNEPRAEFHNTGVLWMPGSDVHWSEREQQRMHAKGIAAAVLDDQQLAERFPAINACQLSPDTQTGQDHSCVGGSRHLLELDGGYIDPVDAVEDLRQACVGAGVDVCLSSRVASIELAGGRVQGVSLASGESLSTPLLINAAGPWCNELYAMAGIKPPWELVPTRIQVLYLDRPPEITGDIPACVDMCGGIYFRSQNRGQQLVVGSALESDEREAVSDPDEFNRHCDAEFEQRILHGLHHRLPALPYKGRVRGYCGLYTVNREDVHPVLGATPVEGFWAANGFSGHGFKLAPAIGAIIAKALTGEVGAFDTNVPLANFAFDRKPLLLSSKSVLA